MKYHLYLILFILLVPICLEAEARDRYRVEVLVLKHLQGEDQAEEVTWLKDYSSALDFLAPQPEPVDTVDPECIPSGADEPIQPAGDGAGPEAADTAPADEKMTAELSADEPPEEAIDPNAVVHVEEMGPEMQEAWRRLRLSGPFRPLQYLAWEQGSEEPFPELRLHDSEIVLADDPYADLRELEEYGVPEDAASLEDNTGPSSEDTACEDPGSIADALPDPTYYYALDGTVSLVRSRFLHLELDLQMRDPVMPAAYAAGTETRPGQQLREGAGSASAPLRPESFLVHELAQRRQVRSARMEYFDGPVIGVLAWITTIPLEEPAER